MSRKLFEDYKTLALLNSQTIAATTTSSAVDIETYDDDALVIASAGGVGAPAVSVTITGSLVATPTVYDQTLGTVATGGPSTGAIGCVKVSLVGIKNIKAAANLPATTTQAAVAVSILVKPFAKTGTINSSTLA